MITENSWGGKNLREMFRSGTKFLDKNAPAINALNVFPVPDGDTGTNMLLTMRAAMVEANLCPDNDASAVAEAMYRGALMGARGNSGVILSQMLRGLAQGLDGKKSCSGSDLANALVRASLVAYSAVSQPVEGTMLTVIREASLAANSVSSAGSCDLQAVLEAAVAEAKESVARTPNLLPILEESGVVDAGGQGVSVILEGALLYIQGRELPEEEFTPGLQPMDTISMISEGEPAYGYCTEFVIRGEALDLEEIRGRISGMGESVLVVGDRATVRVHIHTFDPGEVISYGTSLGTLRQIKIENMEDQHQEFIAAQAGELSKPAGTVSVITVVPGDGLRQVFSSLGAAKTVRGGQTMNPSVEELLRAVESVPTDEVIILPNNPDILPAARQVCVLTNKKVDVVPSRTIPQGIAALLALNHESDLDTNSVEMTKSLSVVRTIEISTAIRSMRYKGLSVKKGQVIGFVDGELIEAGYILGDVLHRLLEKINAEDSEIITVYYGNNVDWAEAERLFEPVRSQYPEVEIEVVFGGQPHYDYIISVE